MSGKMVIAGALGLVGRAVLEHFESLGDWDVVALSRRPADFPTKARFISVDLADRGDCQAKLRPAADATHLVYAALFEKTELSQGWTESDQVATNREMLENLLDVVEAGNPRLRHITLLQGGKAYGAHLGQIILPAKETAPRHMPPNFYYSQEDIVRSRQRKRQWSWTVLRPMIVLGFALASPMNIVAAIGVYAAFCRELGLPFRFPGGKVANFMEATDVRLLARAIGWAGRSLAAQNQIFNITNGDVFLWENVWPALSQALGFAPALGQPLPLSTILADKADLWESIVHREGLATYGLRDVAGLTWQFADSIFGYHNVANTALLSTIKIRQAGFHDCVDTEEALVWWLAELARRKIIPAC